MFAEVLLSKPVSDLDKLFHYSIPEALKDKLKVGHQVLIPFGRRKEIGYVVGFAQKAEVKQVKDVLEITSLEPIFSEKSVELAKWMAGYYFSFFISALRLLMPVGTVGKESRKPLDFARGKRKVVSKPKQKMLLTTNYSQLASFSSPFPLTADQRVAVEKIKSAIDQTRPETFLLYGITGSGKTEVYLQSIAHLLAQGKGAIVMVPEIALTPQMIQRFQARFGDHSAIFHSSLPEKKRVEEWRRVASGEARIVLGTRSAVFAPVTNLGLIILDEEYEHTYKSEKSPRYHARDVALKLAELHNAVVILGSATPSVETYFKSQGLGVRGQGSAEYTKLTLPQRIDNHPLPPVEVIDMREEMKRKNFGVLSGKLREEIRETLYSGEQVILFMNRLGYFTFVICRNCGLTIECPNCSVSLVYHTGSQKLVCHHCDYTTDAPVICPRCQSSAIKYFGSGTQRIEEEVAKVFPAARILRYDRDTLDKGGSHEAFFSNFAEGRANVLIGTQMVAKGLDIANVTLVGVVAADTSLHMPDFRSSEHTFQLLTQVAGRAGRHHLPGKVVIQTYLPESYVIQAAAKHDYEAFYNKEIEFRRELFYPPFSHLINIMISGAVLAEVEKISSEIGGVLAQKISNVLGPAPAAIKRLRGHWRYQVLIKGEELNLIRKALQETLNKIVIPSDVRVVVDVDPMGML